MNLTSSQAASLLFDIQALNEQNEAGRKQMDKRKHEVTTEEVVAQQSTQEELSRKKARSNGQDVISRRRQVVKAMMKKSQKAEPSKQSTSTSETTKTIKGSTVQNAKLVTKEQGIFSEPEILAFGKTFQNLLKLNLKASDIKAPMAEFDIHNGDMHEEMFKRENLINCKLNDTQLAKAKKHAKKLSRVFRQIAIKTTPSTKTALAKAFTQNGIDFGAQQQAQKANQERNIDHSIFASIVEALEISSMLQQLGVKTEVSQMDFIKESSEKLLEAAQSRFEANNDLINKAHHQDCMQKAMHIIGDVIGGLFCALMMPEIGVPIILASNGYVEKLVKAMAEGMHCSEYEAKCLLMSIAVAIAVCSFGAGASASTCMMTVLFVAGLLNWITDSIGAIATGQTDESKFPGWVTWAGMGINIALILITSGQAMLNLARSVMSALSDAASVTVNAAESFAAWISESFNAITLESEAIASEIAETIAIRASTEALETVSLAGSEAAEALTVAARNTTEIVEAAPTISNATTTTTAVAGEEIESMTVTLQEVNPSASFNSASSEMSSVSSSSQGSARAVQQASASGSSRAVSTSEAVLSDEASTSSAASRAPSERVLTEAPVEGAEGEALAPVSPAESAPEAHMESISNSRSVASDTRTIKEKMISYLRKAFVKLMTKLIQMQKALLGASEDASQVAGALRGAEDAASKAEKIAQALDKVMRIMQRLSRWGLLAASGAQGVVEYEMSRCQEEIGQALKELAEFTGQTELFEQYVSTFNASIRSTRENEQEFAQEMASELAVLGAIISTQRRNSTMLMTA